MYVCMYMCLRMSRLLRGRISDRMMGYICMCPITCIPLHMYVSAHVCMSLMVCLVLAVRNLGILCGDCTQKMYVVVHVCTYRVCMMHVSVYVCLQNCRQLRVYVMYVCMHKGMYVCLQRLRTEIYGMYACMHLCMSEGVVQSNVCNMHASLIPHTHTQTRTHTHLTFPRT